MPEYIDRCKECFHFQVCANVMKNQLFIREKMLLEENPECEHFVPTADVVEVVRCKDCKHFCPYEGEEHKGDCAELVGLESCVYEDDFCSYGERKDGDE